MADREISSMADALALIDEYQQAYDELYRDNTRLQHQYIKAKLDLAHARHALALELTAVEFEENPFA